MSAEPRSAVVGCAGGAPFAVLVAEQLHVSGADLVLSITSAGQLAALADPPYFVLIDRAWRDEGISAHYQPPAPWSHLDPRLAAGARDALDGLDEPVFSGSSWTTDAPTGRPRPRWPQLPTPAACA